MSILTHRHSLINEIAVGSSVHKDNDNISVSPSSTSNNTNWRAPGSASRRASIAPIYYSKTNTTNTTTSSKPSSSEDISTDFSPLDTFKLRNRRQSMTTVKPQKVFDLSSMFSKDDINTTRKSFASPFFPLTNSKTRLMSVFEESSSTLTNPIINFNINKEQQRSYSEAFILHQNPQQKKEDDLCNCCSYLIQFKETRNDTFYASHSLNLNVNDYVLVEADRGKDIGKIIQKTTTNPNNQKDNIIINYNNNDYESKEKMKIYRKAIPKEIEDLNKKQIEELEALNHCNQLIKSHNLEMKLIDAEYQFDRKKLTFYFIAKKRIDFRSLVKEMFRTFKTRIWMCAVNRHNNNIINY